jgi:hypothetical protein
MIDADQPKQFHVYLQTNRHDQERDVSKTLHHCKRYECTFWLFAACSRLKVVENPTEFCFTCTYVRTSVHSDVWQRTENGRHFTVSQGRAEKKTKNVFLLARAPLLLYQLL